MGQETGAVDLNREEQYRTGHAVCRWIGLAFDIGDGAV
jgi:hypothetical protein